MLLKFFEKKEYAKSFLEGKIFFSTIKKYRTITDEKGEMRNDILEGYDFLSTKIGSSEIIFENSKIDEEETIKIPLKNLKVEFKKSNRKKIFCMYGFFWGENIKKEDFAIDSRVLLLGEYIVVLTDIKEFLSRIEMKLKEKKYDYGCKTIDYMDTSEYSGFWGEFKKDKKYEYQKEFRISCESMLEGDEIIDIGDISDIAVLRSKEEFLNMKIGFTNKEDLEATEFKLNEVVEY